MGADQLLDLADTGATAGARPRVAADLGGGTRAADPDRLLDPSERDRVTAADQLVGAARRCLDRAPGRPEQVLGDRVAGAQQGRELARAGSVPEQAGGEKTVAIEDEASID